jgi:hypothetical protein
MILLPKELQLQRLAFELVYEYPPSSLEVGFDAHDNKCILEELIRHGFIDSTRKLLHPFSVLAPNKVVGPDKDGLYIVTVYYDKDKA